MKILVFLLKFFEYLSQQSVLSQGLTGEEQVQFIGIDVSTMDNEQIHLYVEGTDWSGLTYQQGGTGGGPGASNSWASVVIAEDVMVEFAGAGLGTGSGGGSTFSLDRLTQDSIDHYLVPGMEHTFKVRLDEPNGFRTIDNITVHLCGYGSDFGIFSYDPYTGDLWSPDNSMLDPISSSTEIITSSITELSVRFSMSWEMPFSDEDFDCKPRVLVEDGLDQIESEVLSSLSWRLDNKIIAIPDTASDLTEPIIPSSGISLYLGQGDEFSLSGGIFHVGSGVRMIDINEDLAVSLSMTYGTGIYESASTVSSVFPEYDMNKHFGLLSATTFGIPYAFLTSTFICEVSFKTSFKTSPATPEPPIPTINKSSYESITKSVEVSSSFFN